MSLDEQIASRLGAIRERITAACERHGRDAGEVALVGACKLQPPERLGAAWRAGLRLFGENRVQEAEAHRTAVPEAARWHLIGPLQSNKAKRAAALFDTVHSLDRIKIARLLDREAGKLGRRLDGYLEINLGDEQSKHGFAPAGLADRVAPLAELEHLRVVGLMAIPPWETDPARVRGWFHRLRELRDRLCERPEWSACPGRLSMGMSGDYEIAVEEGATEVRIGTALFGPRPGAGG